MSKKKRISKPMEVVALRLTEEERERLQAIADEHHVTLSWVIREGCRLYAEDAANYLRQRAPQPGGGGDTAEA
jgi:predicted DNA-binding protein